MDERKKEGEIMPKVTVSIPTAGEIASIFSRVFHEGPGAAQANPEAFRILRCGRKELLFRLGYDQGDTLVALQEGARDEDAVSGETTALYADVKRIIEEHVRKTGIFYTYQLSTKNPAMLAWARGKGRELFQWDQEIPGEGQGYKGSDNASIFVKGFFPKPF